MSRRLTIAGYVAGIAFNGGLLAHSVVLLALVAIRRDPSSTPFNAAFVTLALNAAFIGWWVSGLRLLPPTPAGEGETNHE